ncbi:Flp pilus assembly protein TadB [Rhodopirellula islandica]|uniref:Flp pilus assembly protein TadB n=1 Tax=Rhodopirellula islandica TaxID=595434 RepID=A0A0J1BDZ6_RHOIS|nr:type II secretion system F family protein [Rhodopirellula islandica]KLU04822.1 Flp pilus assembly protein TadB [Rhodopirellula islandica]
MITWLIFIGIFFIVAIMVFGASTVLYQQVLRYQFGIHERLATLSRELDETDSASLFKEWSQSGSNSMFQGLFRGSSLPTLLNQAGIPWTVKRWWITVSVLALVSAMLGAYWDIRLGIATGLIGMMLPFVFLFAKQNARNQQLSRQLPEVFQLISRAVRSGQTVTSALQMIAEDCPSPIREEFALCYEQQELGMWRELAFRKLAERNQVMELRIFVVALLVQNRSGGDLVELLDNLSKMVTKRLRLRDRIKALTAEGRMQALVLMVLPFVALGAIVLFSPEYAETLLERPRLLVATGVSQGIGALLIRRIVHFEY